jgi:hypothetical protein
MPRMEGLDSPQQVEPPFLLSVSSFVLRDSNHTFEAELPDPGGCGLRKFLRLLRRFPRLLRILRSPVAKFCRLPAACPALWLTRPITDSK